MQLFGRLKTRQKTVRPLIIVKNLGTQGGYAAPLRLTSSFSCAVYAYLRGVASKGIAIGLVELLFLCWNQSCNWTFRTVLVEIQMWAGRTLNLSI